MFQAEEKLDLRGQLMQTLSPDLFNDTTAQYVEIDATDTGIEYINDFVVSQQKSLVLLRMDSNPKFLPRRNHAFLISDSLVSYSCSGCGFSTIYTLTFTQLKSLKSLNLSANKLSLIEPGAFKLNSQLERVNLSHNELDERNNFVNIFGDGETSLKVLDLSRNAALKMIPNQALVAGNSLEELYLSECGFDVIYVESFAKLPHLKQLILKSNFIHQIDSNAFATNPNLTYLTLEHNKLRILDKNVIGNSLQYLCLANNSFTWSSSYQMLWERYEKRGLNETASEICESQDEVEAFDWLIRQHLTAGISNAFISTYLLVILLTEVAIVVLLILYLIKLANRLSTEPNDLSQTVLNNNRIYKIYKTN